MRRFCRTDDNQQEIIDALRKIGCSVLDLSKVGAGCPDLLAGYKSIDGIYRNWLIEIKDGNKPKSRRKLTPDQVIFHRDWQGQSDIVISIEEAIKLVTGK